MPSKDYSDARSALIFGQLKKMRSFLFKLPDLDAA
jgi:hypothetical protein